MGLRLILPFYEQAQETLFCGGFGTFVQKNPNFAKPTEQDFADFVASMQAVFSEKTWVHCAANMRVSAFIYRYRCNILGEDRQEARKALEQIWEPFGVWKIFIAQS